MVICISYLTRNAQAKSVQCWASVGTMLGQRRKRWANIVPALAESLCLLGYQMSSLTVCHGITLRGTVLNFYIIPMWIKSIKHEK